MARDVREELLNAAPDEVEYVYAERCPNRATIDVWYVVRDQRYEDFWRRMGRWWSRVLKGSHGLKPERADDYPRRILNAKSDVLQRLVHHFKLGEEFGTYMGWDDAGVRTLTDEEMHELPERLENFLTKFLFRAEVKCSLPKKEARR